MRVSKAAQLGQMADRFKATVAQRGLDFRQAFELMAFEGYQDHRDLTSGTVSSKRLRELGNPFGWGPKKMGRTATEGQMRSGFRPTRGKVQKLPINVQSGRLRSSIRVLTIRRGGVALTVRVSIGAPYAKYVLSRTGTVKMVPRGFREEVEKRWRARHKRLRDMFVRGR